MKKKIFVICIFIQCILTAQTFDYNIKLTYKKLALNEELIEEIFIKNNYAVIQESKILKNIENIMNIQDLNFEIDLRDSIPKFYYYDLDSNFFIFEVNTDEKFFIKDTLPNIKWQLFKDFKKIDNLDCQLATCNYSGRNYIAWFCPTISIKKGPFKFDGLPGLIIEIYDTENKFKFKLANFYTNLNNIIKMPYNYKNISKYKNLKYLKEYSQKYIEKIVNKLKSINDRSFQIVNTSVKNFEEIELE